MQKPLDPMSVERVEMPSASYVLRRRYGPAHYVIAAASWITVISMLLQPVAAFGAGTGFNQTDAGPYDYNTGGNWVGGTINGIWDYSLILTDNQTVTFASSPTLTSGWTFNHGGGYWDDPPTYYTAYTLTLKGTGADRTVTLGGDVSMNVFPYATSVTIGSTTAGENLNIDLGSANRAFTLSNGSSMIVNNAITSAFGTYGITYSGAMSGLSLLGANTYSGDTTVIGGALGLSYSTSNTSKLSDTAVLSLSGASVSLSGTTGNNHVEIVGSTTINAGAANVYRFYNSVFAAGTPTLRMNAITRNSGGTLRIGNQTWEGYGATGNCVTTDRNNVNGILGGWAVYASGTGVDAIDWAKSATSASDTLITAYTGYTTLPTSGGIGTTNYKMTAGTTLGDSFSVNSLKLQSPTGDLALGANTLTINSGGLLMTDGYVRSITMTGTGTRLTAGAGSNYELIFNIYNQQTGTLGGKSGLSISAVIGDNEANSVTLTKSGYGVLQLASGVTQTYSGPTYVNEGWLQVDGTLSAGGGTVTVNGNSNTTFSGAGVSALSGSGTINRPVVLNDGAQIMGGNRTSSGTLNLGSDLTVPQGAVVELGPETEGTISIAGTGTATINGTFVYPRLVMQSGTTLKGSGTLAAYFDGLMTYTPGLVTLKSGATFHPGGSIGKLTVGADISHEAGSIFAWEAKGYTTETGVGTAGTDYSQVAMDSGAKFTIAGGTKLRVYFPAGENFTGTFWNTDRTWDIITGGGAGSSGSIANGDISVYVDNALYDGGDYKITGEGAFTAAYVTDGILCLTWTAKGGTVIKFR